MTLLPSAADRVRTHLVPANAGAACNQMEANHLTEIRRLQQSPMVEDQLVAVGLRLARSRMGRGDVADHLRSHFSTPAISLDIEAERRKVWKLNRATSMRTHAAEEAVQRIEQSIIEGGQRPERELQRWAACYADLWCDPRIRARPNARRMMLTMVSLFHERSFHRRQEGVAE